MKINDARTIATNILNEHTFSNYTINKIIDNKSKKIKKLSRKDRAFANYLIYGVLRWRNSLDKIIKKTSNIEFSTIQVNVINILRIGLFQILFMNNIPNFAAVNTSVNITKNSKTSKRLDKYVNAILRMSIRKYDSNLHKKNKINSIKDFSIEKSFPRWIISRWIKQFGYRKTYLICNSINNIPKITIRINTLKASKEKIKLTLNKEVGNINKCYSNSEIFYISKIKAPISKMQSFINGMFSVQDEAAQIVSLLVNPKPGESILDGCTGLGNKATHMAQLMNNKGKIIAIDNNQSKLDKLDRDAIRLKIKIIKTKKINIKNKSKLEKLPLFDKILIDAPCSGLGVIRRNPDIKWKSSINKILSCAKKQLILLENISKFLKINGELIYSVCSLEREENEDIITAFLLSNPNFSKKIKNNIKIRKYLDKDCFYRTNLKNKKMDGFFIAILKKKQ